MNRSRRTHLRQASDRRDMIAGLSLVGLAFALLGAMPWLFPLIAGTIR